MHLISTYTPLSVSSYVKLPAELKSTKKGLISIKNNDQKCFLWCHVRHVNPIKIHPERITREDKKLVNDLDYDGTEFPVREKDFSKIKKIKFGLTCFVMKTNCLFQFTFQIKNLKTHFCCLKLMKTSHIICISKIYV